MKFNPQKRRTRKRGMTLLELTVVIIVLLSLIGVMFIVTRGCKEGANRTSCIMQIRNIQVTTRAYQNVNGYDPESSPKLKNGSQNIISHLLSEGYISQKEYDSSQGTRPCPGNGLYNIATPTIFPAIGTLYMSCSFSSTKDHTPRELAGW